MSDKPKFKILIVDDERSNIVALSHILKSEYTVLAAINGQTGLEAAQKNNPDLILLDIIMPDMNGFEVLVQLKNSELTQKIPVIFITGLDDIEDEKRGFSLGAVDYITKPFRNCIVEARVKTHLQIVKQIRTIEQLSMIDVLTDLPNRRGFDHQLNKEWARASREKEPLSIFMIDIDNFKKYNDRYGHPQGDKALQALAGIFKRALKRPADFAARWGGEEFAALLPNTNLNGALEVAEQFRALVEQEIILCADGSTSGITVSIGVNTLIPTTNDLNADFISEADKALYTAKGLGKNRVCSC